MDDKEVSKGSFFQSSNASRVAVSMPQVVCSDNSAVERRRGALTMAKSKLCVKQDRYGRECQGTICQIKPEALQPNINSQVECLKGGGEFNLKHTPMIVWSYFRSS